MFNIDVSENSTLAALFICLQVKYVGNGEEQNGLQMTGLNLMDKTLAVRGARIAYSIWDVAGNPKAPTLIQTWLILIECRVP